MDWFVGIDVGGTRTRAFAVDAGATRGAWAEAGPGNPNHVGRDELRRSLRSAVESALRAAGTTAGACVSVFAGVSGLTTEAAREDARRMLADCGLGHARLGIDHDIRIALAGGLGGRPGIALIVGTGSSCYARAADGRTWQAGGWDPLISDEGSGYFLGLEAMSAAARMADGRLADSPLRRCVFEWLGIRHISEILAVMARRGLTRSDIAGFAPKVIQLAAENDAAAAAILDRGAALLGDMVEACYRMQPTGASPEVVVAGGVGTAPTLYREKIFDAIRRLLPAAAVSPPILPPAIGAALLAMEQATLSVTPELVTRLKPFASPPRYPEIS